MSIRDDSRERPWRPGKSSNIIPYLEQTSIGPGALEAERIFTECRAMPRGERTSRLQTVFRDLQEAGMGLTRVQELGIMEALEAIP